MNVIELKQERHRAYNDAQAIHAKSGQDGRELTGEERAEFTKRLEDCRRFDAELAAIEDLRALKPADQPEDRTDGAALGAPAAGESRTAAVARKEEYRDTFTAYLRGGMSEMTPEQRSTLREGWEQRDMLISAATHGGYVVPQDFSDIVTSAKLPAVVMRRTRANVINTGNGRDLILPTQSAFGAAAYLAEGATAPETDDTGAKVTAKAYTVARMVKVSMQLLEDSAVDVATLIGANIGRSFAAFEDPEFLIGTGAGSSHLTGITLNASPTQAATGSSLLFTYVDLLALYMSVAPQYRINGEFVIADSAMGTLLGLKDSQNRPIWTASAIPGEPDTLMSKPLYTSPNFAVEAANSLFGAFGDFANGYTIRQDGAMQVKRTDDRFIDSLETGFIAWERLDAVITDATAFKVWKHSAT